MRVVNVQGFDKGFGGGDLKRVHELVRDFPKYLDLMSVGRINVCRIHMNAGWILHADKWVEASWTKRSAR